RQNNAVGETESPHRWIRRQVAQRDDVLAGIGESRHVIDRNAVEDVGVPLVEDLEETAAAGVFAGADVIQGHIVDAISFPGKRCAAVVGKSIRQGDSRPDVADGIKPDRDVSDLADWADVARSLSLVLRRKKN